MYTLWQAKEVLWNSLMRKESTSLLLKSNYYSKGGKTIITCENKSAIFNSILWILWNNKEQVVTSVHVCYSKSDKILITCGLTESV